MNVLFLFFYNPKEKKYLWDYLFLNYKKIYYIFIFNKLKFI